MTSKIKIAEEESARKSSDVILSTEKSAQKSAEESVKKSVKVKKSAQKSVKQFAEFRKGFIDLDKIPQFSKKVAQTISFLDKKQSDLAQEAQKLRERGGTRDEINNLQKKIQHIQMIYQFVMQKLNECLILYVQKQAKNGWEKIYKLFTGGQIYVSARYLKEKGYVDLTYSAAKFVDEEFSNIQMLQTIEKEFDGIDSQEKEKYSVQKKSKENYDDCG